MGRQLRIEYPGAYYHVTARGNERKEVFKSDKDREKFLSYLESAVVRYGAAIHAYCLMNNHYHLLLETPRGNLSQVMQHINGAYTNYFNAKRKRFGHLFQGRYKAILVEGQDRCQGYTFDKHLRFGTLEALTSAIEGGGHGETVKDRIPWRLLSRHGKGQREERGFQE